MNDKAPLGLLHGSQDNLQNLQQQLMQVNENPYNDGGAPLDASGQ